MAKYLLDMKPEEFGIGMRTLYRRTFSALWDESNDQERIEIRNLLSVTRKLPSRELARKIVTKLAPISRELFNDGSITMVASEKSTENVSKMRNKFRHDTFRNIIVEEVGILIENNLENNNNNENDNEIVQNVIVEELEERDILMGNIPGNIDDGNDENGDGNEVAHETIAVKNLGRAEHQMNSSIRNVDLDDSQIATQSMEQSNTSENMDVDKSISESSQDEEMKVAQILLDFSKSEVRHTTEDSNQIVTNYESSNFVAQIDDNETMETEYDDFPNQSCDQETYTVCKPYMYMCDECGKAFSRNGNLKTHKRIHSGEKPYMCDECGKAFSINGHLKTHKRIHSGEKPYMCDECGKAFYKSDDLKRHKRIHSGEKPYMCNECGKAFSINGHLKTHKRIHSGEKPYMCDECGKAFYKSEDLKTHKRIHSGEKPYMCDECGKAFSISGHLKTHKRIHSGEKPYMCNECGKAFSQSSSLNDHIKGVHLDDPYKCFICPTAMFVTRGGYSAHLLVSHNLEFDNETGMVITCKVTECNHCKKVFISNSCKLRHLKYCPEFVNRESHWYGSYRHKDSGVIVEPPMPTIEHGQKIITKHLLGFPENPDVSGKIILGENFFAKKNHIVKRTPITHELAYVWAGYFDMDDINFANSVDTSHREPWKFDDATEEEFQQPLFFIKNYNTWLKGSKRYHPDQFENAHMAEYKLCTIQNLIAAGMQSGRLNRDLWAKTERFGKSVPSSGGYEKYCYICAPVTYSQVKEFLPKDGAIPPHILKNEQGEDVDPHYGYAKKIYAIRADGTYDMFVFLFPNFGLPKTTNNPNISKDLLDSLKDYMVHPTVFTKIKGLEFMAENYSGNINVLDGVQYDFVPLEKIPFKHPNKDHV